MDWIVLALSGIMESVWATALSCSEGFTNLVPTVVFVIAIVLSMLGLGYAAKTLPIGVAYAVWTGVGVVVTVLFGVATGAEPMSAAKALLLVGLVGCIAGLKVVSG